MHMHRKFIGFRERNKLTHRANTGTGTGDEDSLVQKPGCIEDRHVSRMS